MNLKILCVFSDQMEAQFAAGKLDSQGIPSQIRGAREYVAIVAGGGAGRYELLVDEADFAAAEKILTDVGRNLSVVSSEADTNPEPKVDPNREKGKALRRSLFFAFLAFTLLPIVFNYFSFEQAALYSRLEERPLQRGIWLAMITLLNLVTLITIYYFYERVTK